MSLRTLAAIVALLGATSKMVGCNETSCGSCEEIDPVACVDSMNQSCNQNVCPEAGGCPIGCTEQTGSSGVCSEGTSPSCTGWDPENEVTYANSVYSMDYGFAYDLSLDIRPIWGCDGISISHVTDGWEISGADDGDLLYELGLRDGDILVELNGYPIDTEVTAAYAYFILWLWGAETEYELTIIRDEGHLALDYELIATKP